MRSFVATCFVLLLAAPTTALAADPEPPLNQDDLQSRNESDARPYFREHRLRAYERTRAGLRQGATCVTPKAVCWIGEPLTLGASCSCETRRFGTLKGTIGG